MLIGECHSKRKVLLEREMSEEQESSCVIGQDLKQTSAKDEFKKLMECADWAIPFKKKFWV
jgi:hypothetical protein